MSELFVDRKNPNNYLKLDRDIILNKTASLSITAFAVLVKLLAYSDSWELNLKLFEEKHNINKRNRLNAFKELEAAHFFYHFEYRLPGSNRFAHAFFVSDYPKDFTEDVEEYKRANGIEDAKTDKNFDQTRGAVPDLREVRPINIYNRIDINKSNIISKNFETSENPSKSVHEEIMNFHEIHEHDKHDLTDTSTFRDELKKENLTIDGSLTFLNNSVVSNPISSSLPKIPKPKKKSENCVKGTDAEGKKTRNKQEVNMAKAPVGLESMGCAPLSAQTKTEQELNRCRQELNRLKEAEKIRKEKECRETNRHERIYEYIDRNYTDLEINGLLRKHIQMVIDVRNGGLNYQSYLAILSKLDRIAKDKEDMKAIIEQALERGWQTFWEVKKSNKAYTPTAADRSVRQGNSSRVAERVTADDTDLIESYRNMGVKLQFP